ncbi:MAG: ATP-binding protein [Oscillospiraceae bacterium]|jgi:DNA replication protein DnaC|nr:ATP-binding protein [Oscillospiraceae bacterium]
MNTLKSRLTAQAENTMRARRFAALDAAAKRKNQLRNKIPTYVELEMHIASLSAKRLKATDPATLEQLTNAVNTAVRDIENLLVKYNVPVNYAMPRFECNRCSDMGVLGAERCDCFRKLVNNSVAQEINRNSSIELKSFNTFTLNKYRDERKRSIMAGNLRVCREFADNFHLPCDGGLFLRGRTGLGKTHLSLAIANEVINQNYVVIYDSAINIIDAVLQSVYGSHDNNADNYKTADLLIIDDLGREYSNPQYSEKAMFEVINYRLNSGLPCIVNTNLRPKELYERYGEGVVSRLYLYTRLTFEGDDVRMQEGERQDED